jgi:hypothetical protein
LALNNSSLNKVIRGNYNKYNLEELVSRKLLASNPGLLDIEIRESNKANLGEQRSAKHFLTNSEPSYLVILETRGAGI